MQKQPEHIEALTRVCVDDLIAGFGLGRLRRGRRLLELLSRIPAQRVAREVAHYDQIVAESGLIEGGARNRRVDDQREKCGRKAGMRGCVIGEGNR